MPNILTTDAVAIAGVAIGIVGTAIAVAMAVVGIRGIRRRRRGN